MKMGERKKKKRKWGKDRIKGGGNQSIGSNYGIWSNHFMANRWGNNGNSDRLYFGGAPEGIKTQNVSLNVETDVTKAVDKAADSVVGITNLQSSNFWADETTAEEAGTGSGVIYKKSGGKAFIVTNNHVVQGATELEVTLSNGKKISAELIGADIWTDLAVVEVDASEITKVAEFGNSDTLKAGEPVIAIGNPLGLTFSGSVTQGIGLATLLSPGNDCPQ